MELRVLKIFVDKETKKQLAIGDVIVWTDEERAMNAIQKGYVESIKPVAEKVSKAAEVEKPVKKRTTKKSK